MPTIRNPHDEFFKALMNEKAMAKTYFQHFLPADIVEHLNFEQLELDSNSYITPELEDRYSDIVYTCTYKDYTVDLPLLLEHKSSPVEYPQLQLLRYMIEIWQNRINANQGLRPILPIIFYHGEKSWKVKAFHEYFEWMEDKFLPYVPNFSYILTDLSTYSHEELFKIEASFFINALLVLKYRGNFSFIRHSPHKT